MANRKRKYRSDLKEYKITVKVSETELEMVDKRAAEVGINRSKYIRALIHGKGCVDNTFATDRAKFIRQVSGIATNINQIARMINTNKYLARADIFHVEKQLEELLRLFKEVLSVWQLQKS